jgi:predicted PurR-regulated permease PerM
MFRTILSIIFSEKLWKKLIAWTTLAIIALSLTDFVALFFIIFICTYIFLETGESIAHKIHNWGEQGKRDTRHKLAAKYATTNIVVTILYILFISVVTFVFVSIVPKIGSDVQEFIRKAPVIASQ